MKNIIRVLALLLFVGTVTLTQQGCLWLFSDSEDENGNSSAPKNNTAQSIVFSDCSIETNSKDDNGNPRMVYHFTAELSGMKEHGIQMVMSVESPKGTPYTYVDEEGDEIIVRAKKDFQNKNQTDSFSLKNKILGIENSKLHLKDGENTFYVRLTAYDEDTHAEIGSSPYMAVTITGKGNSEPSATFSQCSLEHNVMYNDRKMLKCNYIANVQGVKGHDIQFVMTIESPKGTFHYGNDGKVLESKSKTLTASYDNSKFDRWQGFYNDNLNPLPGKNTYYVRITAKDLTTGKTLGESDYLTYTQTGSSNSKNNSSNNNSSKNKSNNNSSKNQSSSGPSVTFSQCNLEHNVIHNDRKMLKCNYTANVIGVKGHEIQFTMTIECPKGTLIYGKDGKVLEAKSKTLTASYENTKFDKWQGIYNDNLNPFPGKNTYYVRITAKDLTTGKTLGKSDYLTYTQTGSSNSNNNSNKKSNASYSPSTSLQKGYYYIHIAKDPNYCIEVKNGVANSGQNIQLQRSDGSAAQQWYFEPNNDGSYYIRSRLNNDYVLDAKGGIAADGTNLILYRFNGKANQRWYIEQCSQDLYYIHSALNDNYVIDLEQANVQNGANIEIYHSKHNNAQRWKINK